MKHTKCSELDHFPYKIVVEDIGISLGVPTKQVTIISWQEIDSPTFKDMQ